MARTTSRAPKRKRPATRLSAATLKAIERAVEKAVQRAIRTLLDDERAKDLL